ncbi:MAG: C40 family peptidase [Dermatophilaceae bacterium]
MSQHRARGRHRSATPYSPIDEFRGIARVAGQSAARVSAIAVASGGLVAAVAVPSSSAAPSAGGTPPGQSPTVGAGARALAGSPAAFTSVAVVAPTAPAPATVPWAGIGVAGVRAVPRPAPEPVPEPERIAPRRVDRPAAAESTSTSTSTPDSKSGSSAPRPAREVPSSATGVVAIARSLLGIPYHFGGELPGTGFDCSGFTQYVFGKAGLDIPRTASQQQNAATPVDTPRPGDLVFFGSPAWHVGIYTGNGMMIDSPRAGKSTSERDIFDGVSGYGRF